jgi:NADH-quinone oxidoreductase subunit G
VVLRSTNDDLFMADVNITVDGKKVTAPAGTLLIEACKGAGI